MGKLTRKAHIKVGNHPHTNMISKAIIMRGGEYKCRIFEVHLKLRDHQLKTITYIYRLVKVMVTANQKSIIDIHTNKKGIQTRP